MSSVLTISEETTLSETEQHVRSYLYQCNEDKADYAHGDYNLLWAEMQKLGITYEYP